MVIQVADDPNIVLIEQAVYPFSTFIADVGGAFGLALGLSLMGILQAVCRFLKVVLSVTFKSMNINNLMQCY